MQVVILSDDIFKEEFLSQGTDGSIEISWIGNADQFSAYNEADAFIDLLYDASSERLAVLKKITVKPVFINSVIEPLENMPGNFIRINGWNSFLKRAIVEAAAKDGFKMQAEKVMAGLNKKIEWVNDVPGFISARVIAMIINEAYFSLAEGVSSKQEIDTAMKLGTNYPYGPFEWADKIGLKKILTLLKELSKEQERYQPAALLEKEVNS